MTHRAILGELLRGWPARDLSERARATARLGILDVVGCIVGGSTTRTAALVREYARASAANGPATVIATGLRLAPSFAALANGVAGHVLDYDDMNSTMLGHPSVVIVPAIFALAQPGPTSGAALVAAYVLGLEVNAHFGRTMVPGHYEAGWHATSSLGIFGATAAAAAILGLDAERAMNALAIAASASAGLRANFGSMTKSLHAGQAAEGAVRAALLSAQGFGANADVFDIAGGYFAAYGGSAPKPAAPSTVLEAEEVGIGIKPYACCGAGVTAIDAALDLRATHGLSVDRIEWVDVLLTRQATEIMPFGAAVDGLQAKYSLAYCVAVALLDGRAGLEQFDDARVVRDDVQRLAGRVRIRTSDDMAHGGGRFGVEMTVVSAGGGAVSTHAEIPRGHPSRPLEPALQLEKFLECTARVLGEARAREAARWIDRLDETPDLAPLFALLGARAQPESPEQECMT